MKHEVVQSVKNIDSVLLGELLDEQKEIVQAQFRRDYEKVLLKAGKFTETLFQIFEYIQNQTYSQQPRMNDVEKSLANLPEGTVPESIRIILPRLGKAVYSIRSKRGGGHKTRIPPQEIDAYFCVSASKYIVAELFRLYSDLPDEVVSNFIREYLRPKLPLIEEFEDGQLMILVDTNSCRDKAMLVLYHLYPARVSNDELRKHIKGETAQNVLTSLANAERKKLVHRSQTGTKLTELGKEYIETAFKKKIA